MTRTRIATFNVENLFNRARVLNFFDHEHGTEKLKNIALLEAELRKPVYDKAEIARLYALVEDVVRFNITRSRVGRYIISRSHGQWRVHPDGPNDWAGTIEFKRAKFDDTTTRNTARVIREVDAHILCIIEVENRLALETFNSDRLASRYPYNILIDGNDSRGIDIGLYSKFEFGTIRTNIFDGTAQSRTFPRDCLEVEVLTPGGPTYLLMNHFTSKSLGGDDRRERQAQRLNELLQDRYNLADQRVVVAGDLNDTPDSAPLGHLLGNNGLTDVLKLAFPNDSAMRWTYHYDRNEQIDYILVSTPLASVFQGAGVERRGIADVDGYSNGTIIPFSSVTSWRDAASDHGAVWADFDL